MQPEPDGLNEPKGERWWDVPVPMPWTALFAPSSGVPPDQVPRLMAWYRRRIAVPDVPPLSRLVLHFEAVNFYAVVLVNGRRCGEHLGDAVPFDIDITDFVTSGGEAEVLVGVQDISFAETRTRSRSERRLLYPGLPIHPGIWGDVSLRSIPALHIVGVSLRTTLSRYGKDGVQEGRVRVSVAVQNSTGRPLGFSLTNEIYDGARQALAFAPIRGTVGAGERATIEMGTPWASAALWWPDQPHLYTLRSALWSSLSDHGPDEAAGGGTGDVVDRIHTSIGFREFRVEGDRFLLNGVPTQLRSESVCPVSGHLYAELAPGAAPTPASPDEARERLTALKDKRGLNAIRFRRVPPSAALLGAADAVGLLVIVEFPLPDDEGRYAIDDPRFWVNTQALARQWIEARAHHPSIIIWSVAQGMVHRYGPAAADSLDSLTYFVADVDPTRLVENSGDAGQAETSGLVEHMPFSVFFPATGVAFRTAGPYEPDSVRERVLPASEGLPDPWLPARPPNRPLCITDRARRQFNPNALAFFLGETAYAAGVDLAEATAPLAMLETGACRIAKLAAIHTIGRPVPPPGLSDTANDVAALPKELFANFYAGTRFVENLVLRNDTRFDQDFDLISRFTTVDGEDIKQQEELLLAAGADAEKAVAFDLPDRRKVYEAAAVMSSLAELTVTFAGTRSGSFEHRRKIALWPHVRSAGTRRIGLYDPDGKTAAALSAVGAKYSAAHSASHDEFDTIVIGENALDRESPPEPDALRSFVADGGLVLCLAQRDVPYDLSPVTTVLDEQRAAAIAFARDAEHPALRGLSTFEMRWWQDDHRVASTCFRKPSAGNFRCLVDVGGPGGLRWAAAVEVCHGRGSYIFSQLALVEKAARAPIAGLLLARLADARPSWNPVETRVLSRDGLFARVGVSCPRLDSAFAGAALAGVQMVLATGEELEALSAEQIETLHAWVEQGGCLYLHFLLPDHAGMLASLSGCNCELVESPQARLVFNRAGWGLARGLCSADLYFLDHGAGRLGTAVRRVHAADVIVKARRRAAGIVSTVDSPSEYGLVELRAGKGRVIVDQVRWDVDTWADARAARYVSTLLTNLGVPLEPPNRPASSAQSAPLDLAAICNSSVVDHIPGDGQGWTGRGQDSDLSAFTPGLLVADGVPFRVRAGEHNCCVLGAESGFLADPIPVGREARELAFLVACEGPQRHGVPVAHLTVRHGDGLETQIPLRYGIDVLDWNERPRHLEGAAVAWKGFTRLGEPAALYVKRWENNRADVPLAWVVFSSTRSGVVPILLAATALQG